MVNAGLVSILFTVCALGGPEEKLPAQNAMRPGARTNYLIDRLADTANFDGFDDPRFTFQDALEYLTDRYDLSFNVDEKAFAKAFGKEHPEHVLSEFIAKTPIPRVRGASLETILRKILARIEVPSGATYLIHKDHILITTQAAASMEVLGDSNLPLPTLLHRKMEKRLLRDALDEVADLTDVTVVLDESAGEKAKETVTARFLNTPVETAVRLLANKADLTMVHLDNVLYVTTHAKAAALRDELDTDKKARGRERMPLADEPAPKKIEK